MLQFVTRAFVFAFALLQILRPIPLFSAQIGPSRNSLCDFAFNGEIVSGDLDRLKQASPQPNQRLCLNSPGGDYDEALRIIKSFRDTFSLGTVVDKGAECDSACAFIFMFGTLNEGDGMVSRSRKLHTLGKLGFHSPRINPAGEIYSDVELAKQYRNGIMAITNILEADWNNMFPKSLLIEALRIDSPSKFFYVDTVGKVAAADIELMGFHPPSQLTQQMLERACLAKTSQEDSQSWSRWEGFPKGSSGGREAITSPSTQPISFLNHRYRAVFNGFGAENDGICVVDVYDAGSKGLHISVNFGHDLRDPNIPKIDQLEKDVNTGNPNGPDPLWLAYGPQAKLSDLAK
jgi:hypothetical protein